MAIVTQGAGEMDVFLSLCDPRPLQPVCGGVDDRPRELAVLAKKLIEQSCEKQGSEQDQLIIHSDRGPSMTLKSVALLLANMGITKSLSRPYVSNDTPIRNPSSKP